MINADSMRALRTVLLAGATVIAVAHVRADEGRSHEMAVVSGPARGSVEEDPGTDSCSDQEQPVWLEYEAAVVAGRDRNQPVVLYFVGKNCRQCELLEKNGFNRPDIACYLNHKLAPSRVETAKRGDLKAKYRVSGTPTVYFLTPAGKEIDYFTGYVEPEKLKLILRYVGEGAYQKMSFDEFEKIS